MKRDRDYYFDRIDEAINELTSDYEDFESFKKGVNDPNSHTCFVYSQVDPEAIPNVCINGAEGAKEFMNTDHMYYGRGIYTTLSFDYCTRYHEGNAMIKYAVKNGAFDNFLIFDIGIRKLLYKIGVLTVHEKISSTIKRLFSPQDFQMLEGYYGKNLINLDDKVMKCDMDTESWSIEDQFWRIFRGERNMELRKGKTKYHNERKLDESNVDGFCYFAHSYGPVAIFRTTDILTPVSYARRGRYNVGGRNSDWPAEKDFIPAIANEEAFEQINATVDGFRRGRKDYPDTGFTDKTICGFAMVRRGNKYNFYNSRTNQLFSPLDFDRCIAFDVMAHTAICAVNFNGETFEFEITSERHGRDIGIRYRATTDSDPQWEETNYQEFCDFMNEIKSQQGGNAINESVEEVFTHKSHADFMKTANDSGNVYLYRASSPETAKSEYENGCNFEYIGTKATPTTDDSLYYGFGVYTVRDLNSILGSKYGRGICKFVLKDGYKDFLILDDNLRAKYDSKHKTAYDELVDLIPKDLFDELDKKFKNNGLPTYLNNSTIQGNLERDGMSAFKNINVSKMPNGVYNTASFARGLKLLLQGHRLHDKMAAHAYDELLMSKTKIRGFVYNGGADGQCVFVRDTNSLMPVSYSVDGGKTWIDDNGNEERFNRLNQKVHPWYLYKNEYNKMGLRDRASCEFSLVKGDQGCNYKDIWFHRPLLPVDAENALSFDIMGKNARFTLAGVPFEVRLEDTTLHLFYEEEDGSMAPCSYDELMEFIGEAKNQGILKNAKFYPNNLLKDGVLKR